MHILQPHSLYNDAAIFIVRGFSFDSVVRDLFTSTGVIIVKNTSVSEVWTKWRTDGKEVCVLSLFAEVDVVDSISVATISIAVWRSKITIYKLP